jgi:hypothetical protein
MKTSKYIITAGALMLSCLAFAGERSREKNDTTAFARLARLVESRCFRVEATDAYPTGNSSVTISSRNGSTTLGGEGHVSLATNRGELFFRDSVVSGHLPFFGRAYSLPYGEGGGFKLEDARLNKVKVKTVQRRKRRYVEFTCSVYASGDALTLSIEAYENGHCTIQVNSNNRAAISYGGTISPLEKACKGCEKCKENEQPRETIPAAPLQ